MIHSDNPKVSAIALGAASPDLCPCARSSILLTLAHALTPDDIDGLGAGLPVLTADAVRSSAELLHQVALAIAGRPEGIADLEASLQAGAVDDLTHDLGTL